MPNPGQSRTCTCGVNSRQSSTVLSVLPESTTMISSAQATDCRHSRMLAASFLVMMMTDRLVFFSLLMALIFPCSVPQLPLPVGVYSGTHCRNFCFTSPSDHAALL